MRKPFAFLLLTAGALSTAGCALFGGGRGGPRLDEFAVARNAPLVIPPDYSLAPPAPGAAVLTAQDAQRQAITALFGGPAPRSAGEMSLLERAGADRAALGARSLAGSPDTQIVDKGPITQTILNVQPGDSQEASVQTP